MSSAWAGGSTRRWRKTRQVILIRDNHACQLTLPGCTGEATEVHHLYGKASGDDPSGLVAACRSCNGRVGDPLRPGAPRLRAVAPVTGVYDRW